MEFTIHNQILLIAFLVAVVIGAVTNKTNFCTMGAVSDWVHMDDKGRLRAWLLAIAVALIGVMVLEGAGKVVLSTTNTFPPYRSGNFAWLRYVLGGMLFGIGMTLGSGCGSKTCVRIGGGNLKSLVVLTVAALAAYAMLWTELFEKVFMSWMGPTIIDLTTHGISSQELGDIVASISNGDATMLHYMVGGLLALTLLIYVFKSADFRASLDNILGGLTIGLCVTAGWYVTAGPMGADWKNYAEMAVEIPSRVQSQSYTFISPMGDAIRYAQQPMNLHLLNFGIMALAGVIIGSFLYAVVNRSFHIEWFPSLKDFVSHAAGGALMGIGGVLAMGCTIGQGVTGVSTLALGSIMTFIAIVFGAALTMKVQYYRMDEQSVVVALHSALADMRLLPRKA